jgi:uncharacterized membrane protein YccC
MTSLLVSPPRKRGPRPNSRLREHLRQLPLSLNLQALSLAEGLRAALSVAVIIALNEYLQWPPLGEAVLAALLTCLCDPGGPIRRRVPVLLAFTLVGGLATAGIGLARGGGIVVALPLGVFALFCASLVRIYGQSAQQVGALLSTVLVLALDRALPDVTQAGIMAATFIGGGLWAVLLTMVIWRLHPFLPARRRVAQVYRALSVAVGDLQALLLAGGTDETAWTAHAQLHWQAVRTTIEAAREIVLDTLRARGASNTRAQQGLIRLETSDQIFGGMIAFSDALERGDARQRAVAERLLRRLRPLLLVLAQSIVTDSTKSNRQIARAIAAMAADAATLPEADAIRGIAEQIIDRLRIAYTLAVPANFLPGAGLDGSAPSLRERLLRPLQANLIWRSPALRHALRSAVVAAPALAFTMIWFTPYDHWLTITIVMTMQPYFGLTYTRALERIGGTVAGGLVAVLVGLVCTTPISIAIAMFPLCVAALAVRAVSFGLFIVALTPLIVLLVDLGQPGTSEWLIAGMRALFTVLGGVVAVVGCLLLWPSWEPERLGQEMPNAIGAQGRYAATVLSYLLGEQPIIAVERARRAAGIASNSLEASISRALLEPVFASRQALEAAMVIDAALRRCAGRSTAMMHDPAIGSTLPRATWQTWRDWIARSTAALAAGGARLDARPTASVEAVARIGRQIELIAGTLERLAG